MDTFDPCASPVWMPYAGISSSTPSPIRKVSIAYPSLWTYFGSFQQTFPSWKSVTQRREHQIGYSCPQSKHSMFSYIFKPVSLEVPLSLFLFLGALSSLFHSHAHVGLPLCPCLFHPLYVEVLNFNHFYMLLYAHTHAFSYSWTFSLQDPASPLHPTHSPCRYACTVHGTPKKSVWEDNMKQGLQVGNKLTFCQNPSTGQGLLFSQHLVLSPQGRATPASGHQVWDPGDQASASLGSKTPDPQLVPHTAVALWKHLLRNQQGK